MKAFEEKLILLLRLGVWTSFALLALGLLRLALTQAPGHPAEGLEAWYSAARILPLPELPSALLTLDGSALLNLGLLALILTPFLRVLLATLNFAARREWAFAAITGTVLAILTLSTVVS